MIEMRGLVAGYKVESMEAAIIRMYKWIDQGLVNERDCCEFIMQLFHQIPESTYNDIIEKSCE